MKPKWRVSHARGYLGLGMVAEAAAELDHLPATTVDPLEVLALRVAIFQERQNWPALRDASAELARRAPDEAAWWITLAYATRRADSLAAAEEVLLVAETKHPAEPTIQFNLGCYACQLGRLDEARLRVDRAIALDATFRAIAGSDPYLAPLRAAPAVGLSTEPPV
jgi:tetratricopeptide (TPR) repeat protein